MLGKAWSAAVSLAVVPVYVHLLGIETYGLIGFYVSLTAVLSLMDLGFGTALNRQFAQYSAVPGNEAAMRNLLRTLEIVYWATGIVLGAAVVAVAPWVAQHWFQAGGIATADLAEMVMLMGVAFACQWPRALYSSGLLGIQQQVVQNVIASTFLTALNIGGVLVIWRISPTLQAFLGWQIAVSLAESVVTGAVLWKHLPATSGRARFDMALLRGVWRFAAGMAAITFTAVVLAQMDKILLSKILPLEAYGYYMLAWRLTTGLYYIVFPVSTAFFPKFSQLVALGDRDELARLYHRSSQFLSVVLLPIAAMMVLFPGPLLLLWTWDAAAAERSGPLLAWLALGTALNGLMNLPLALHLAHGSTRLVFYYNLVAVVVLGPLIYALTVRHGGLGAAWAWLALNAGYVFFLLPLMHRRVLAGHLAAWYVDDVGRALAAAAGIGLLCLWLVPVPQSRLVLALMLGACIAAATTVAALAAPQTRALLLHWGSRLRGAGALR